MKAGAVALIAIGAVGVTALVLLAMKGGNVAAGGWSVGRSPPPPPKPQIPPPAPVKKDWTDSVDWGKAINVGADVIGKISEHWGSSE